MWKQNRPEMVSKNIIFSEVSKDSVISYARQESLFYFEVSAMKNEGVNKMIYSAISELPLFCEDGADTKKIALELEEQNKPQVNISIISGVDINLENEKPDGNDKNAQNVNGQGNGDVKKNSAKLKGLTTNKVEKKKCC